MPWVRFPIRQKQQQREMSNSDRAKTKLYILDYVIGVCRVCFLDYAIPLRSSIEYLNS